MLLKTTHTGKHLECGCDEAGRGALAGPVFASAVILSKDFYDPFLNDSKKVPEKHRNRLRKLIEKKALYYSVAFVEPLEIDEVNILNASFKAMHKAIERLKVQPEHLLIDGNRFAPYKKIPHSCHIKGDAHFTSIAAASILAKTYRDEYMRNIHEQFPQYQWYKNKGYPTQAHKKALIGYGFSIHHRKTFGYLKKK